MVWYGSTGMVWLYCCPGQRLWGHFHPYGPRTIKVTSDCKQVLQQNFKLAPEMCRRRFLGSLGEKGDMTSAEVQPRLGVCKKVGNWLEGFRDQ